MVLTKTCFISLYLGLSALGLTAQSIASVQHAYQQAGRQVVLLKNDQEIIPFKSLMDSHPVLVTATPNRNLLDALHKYEDIKTIDSKKLEQGLWPAGTNLFILSWDQDTHSMADCYQLSVMLERTGIPYIVVIEHGYFASMDEDLFPKAKAIVLSWGASEYIPIQIAQILYGASAAIGRLPFFLNNTFTAGAGLNSSSLNRLQYAPPEMVNIPGTPFNRALRNAVEQAIRDTVFPGANLLVAKDGMVIFHEAFGKTEYDGIRPLHPDDMYDLASITKIFGATLGSMYLHSRGRFDVEAPLQTYLPGFSKSNKGYLKWKDILTHRAGLPASIVYYKKVLGPDHQFKPRTIHPNLSRKYSLPIDDSLFANKKMPDKILNTIKDLPLLTKNDYVYSDLSMILLYRSIQNITKLPFDQFLSQSIYGPLGLPRTVFLPIKKFTKDMTVPTEVDTVFRHTLVHGWVHDENAALLGGISGHAGLFSTANDMAIIAQMLLNHGSYGGQEYIKPATIAEYTHYQYPELHNRRGLGFDKPLLEYNVNSSHVAREASPLSFGHSGFTGTFIWIDPKYNLTYILLTNRVYPSRSNNKISQYSVRPCIQQIIYDYILDSESKD